jgi:hypothetical protein
MEWELLRGTQRKPNPNAMSTTIHMYCDLGMNPGHHGGIMVNKWMNYGMAITNLENSNKVSYTYIDLLHHHTHQALKNCLNIQLNALNYIKQQKKPPWPLVRERTIPTKGRHLSMKFRANFYG